jgi:hypothetical protein
MFSGVIHFHDWLKNNSTSSLALLYTPFLPLTQKRAHQNRQGEKIRQLKLSNYPLDNQPKDPFS